MTGSFVPRSLTRFLDDLPTVTIVDVGASLNAGRLDYQSLIDSGKTRVIGFDGNADAAAESAEHLGGNAQIFPYLIGDGQPATFYETKSLLTSSLYRPDAAFLEMFTSLPGPMRVKQETPVETVRLDDIEEIDTADALFLDVQGAELDVIRNAERIMKDVLIVHTEVEFAPLYENQPLFSDVDPVIRGHGLMFHQFYWLSGRPFAPIVVGGDENLNLKHQMWADAVYMADPRRYDDLANDQLLKLALIMNDLYDSIDVAFIALQAFDRRNGTRHAPDYMAFLASPD